MCKETFDKQMQLDRHSCNSSQPVSPTAKVYLSDKGTKPIEAKPIAKPIEWKPIEATKKTEQVEVKQVEQATQAERVEQAEQVEQAEVKQAERDVKSAKISLEIAIRAEQQLASKIDAACTEVAKAEETVAKANKILLVAQTALEKAKTEHSNALLVVEEWQKTYDEKSSCVTLLARRQQKMEIKAKIERLQKELVETQAQFEAIEPSEPVERAGPVETPESPEPESPVETPEPSEPDEPIETAEPSEPPTVCTRCPEIFNSHIEWCYHLNFTCQGVCATAIQRWWRRRGVLSKPKRTLKRKRIWDDDEDFLLIAQHKKHGIHFSRYDMPERTRSSIKARYYRLFKEKPLRLWREVEL